MSVDHNSHNFRTHAEAEMMREADSASDTSDGEEEMRREFERDIEEMRRVKPWDRRVQRWLTKGHDCTAIELLRIAEFFTEIKSDELEVAPSENLEHNGHLMPVAEMRLLIEWWHTDPVKRTLLNKMLLIYSKCSLWKDGEWDGREGPEHHIAKGWILLDAEQRSLLKTMDVTADEVWDGIHDDGECPVRSPTWAFVEDYAELVRKHTVG